MSDNTVDENSEDTIDEDPFAQLDTEEEGSPEELFEEIEVPELDEDELWETVLDGTESANARSGETETVVSKQRYCVTCEHFSSPPETSCNHPDAEIVESVGIDRFRLRNCPVVDRRRRAETAFPDDG